MISSLQSIAQLGGAHIVNGIVEGLVVAFFASAFLWAISCRNSGTRFAVWFLTLLAVVALSLRALVPVRSETIVTRLPHWVLPVAWATYAFVIWIAIASAGLLRVALAIRHVVRLKSSSVEIGELDLRLQQALADFHSIRPIELRVSDDLRVPTAIGFIKPAILLPRWAVEELSLQELNAVILHELGHLRRWDDWTNLAQKIVRAILFFHPGVWWIDARLTLEREMACDDLVLARIGNARGYAECLVSVAEKSAVRSRLALALAAVSRMKQTAMRITRILDRNRMIETRMSRAAVSVVAAVSGIALFALPHTPSLIAFQTNTSAAHVATSRDTYARSRRPASIPMAVPAHFTESNSTPRLVQATIHYEADKANNVHKKKTSRVKRTTVKRPTIASPGLTRASLSDAQSTSSPAMIFVVQTEEYGDQISHFWTVCVWRVTVPANSPAQKQVPTQNGTVSKSI